MDINYHYYVTYQAAIEAGFTKKDAKLIARADQFVDENSQSFLSDIKKRHPDFNCKNICYTTQTTKELIKSDVHDYMDFWKSFFTKNRAEVKKIAQIWPVFHFLPGDYAFVANSIKSEFQKAGDIENYGSKLICGPESDLVKKLVTDVKADSRDINSTGKLLRIGITMHVLADTFAHQRFVGLPSCALNEVDFVFATDGYELEPLKEAEWRLATQDKGKKRVYSPAPVGPHSFGYLGHGRIGHMPDEPGVVFGYHPAWDKNEPPAKSHIELDLVGDPVESYVYRANYIEFLSAYEQMIAAMKFIRGAADAFNEKVDKSEYDRAQIYDPDDRPAGITEQKENEILRLQKIMNLFAKAEKDSKLKDMWCQSFGITDVNYTPPNDVGDFDFIRFFNMEAKKHQTFVINNTPKLAELISKL